MVIEKNQDENTKKAGETERISPAFIVYEFGIARTFSVLFLWD